MNKIYLEYASIITVEYYTVFARILAAATINFSLARVWLLIEGSSYSRAAFINFGAIPLGDIDMMESFFRTEFRIVETYDREVSSRTKPGTFSAMFFALNKRSFMACM